MRPLIVALLLLSLACASGTGPFTSKASTPSDPPVSAPIVTVPLTFPGTELPPEVKITGTPMAGARWTDAHGENWLVLTRQEEEQYAILRVILYFRGPSGWSLASDWMELYSECTSNPTVALVPGSLQITDLDADGEPEAAYVYRYVCPSDARPPVQRLHMKEGRDVYMLNGHARVEIPGRPAFGGEFCTGFAFADAPPTFLPAAAALWKKSVTEPS